MEKMSTPITLTMRASKRHLDALTDKARGTFISPGMFTPVRQDGRFLPDEALLKPRVDHLMFD